MKELTSIGVMTGTSCDGVDFAALHLNLSVKGQILTENLIASKSYGFPKTLRTRLLNAQDGRLTVVEYGRLSRDFSLWLSNQCLDFIKNVQSPRGQMIFGVHGQTIWHEPPLHSPAFNKPGFSIQMVDAALIAQRTGIVTVSQFRQPDLAMGGQGAPLVPSYHWLLAQQISTSAFGAPLPIAIHNIGGISNLTYLSEKIDDLMAFDTGPGNALIDLAVAKATKGKLRFDKGGRLAKTGQIDWKFVNKLACISYFKKKPPKSTGREFFNKEFLLRFPMKGADLVANATALTALTMADAYAKFILTPGLKLNGVYLGGGGAKNTYLCSLFSQLLCERAGTAIVVRTIPEQVAPAAYLEAMAFARLAVEALMGRPVTMPQVTGAVRAPLGAAIFQADNYREILKIISVLE